MIWRGDLGEIVTTAAWVSFGREVGVFDILYVFYLCCISFGVSSAGFRSEVEDLECEIYTE